MSQGHGSGRLDEAVKAQRTVECDRGVIRQDIEVQRAQTRQLSFVNRVLQQFRADAFSAL